MTRGTHCLAQTLNEFKNSSMFGPVAVIFDQSTSGFRRTLSKVLVTVSANLLSLGEPDSHGFKGMRAFGNPVLSDLRKDKGDQVWPTAKRDAILCNSFPNLAT